MCYKMPITFPLTVVLFLLISKSGFSKYNTGSSLVIFGSR